MPKYIKNSRLLAIGAGILAIGYSIGVLTAPRSGSATRNKIAYKAKKTKKDLETELNSIFDQTKKSLKNLSDQNPRLTTKVKAVKDAAEESQKKIKELIAAVKSDESLDSDLEAALNNARQALNDLKTYISK